MRFGFTPFRPGDAGAGGPRVGISVEWLVLVACAYWLLSANVEFFVRVLKHRPLAEPATWAVLGAAAVIVVSGHALVLLLVATRHTVKPLIALLAVASAAASWFTGRYGVLLDPSMIHNVVQTNPAEAWELFTPGLLVHLLLNASLPLLLLWHVQVAPRPLPRALAVRAVWLVGLAALAAGGLVLAFQPISSLMRNDPGLRYLITPGNLLWSGGKVAAAQMRATTMARIPIGIDAQPGPGWQQARRPRLLVLVVGETARAANWGLGGYERQTTPQLAGLPVINFTDVQACGTSTEVSLPCMFAPVGRRNYDEQAIRGSESLLHVVARAGGHVLWLDNQSGCKGVCQGLPQQTIAPQGPADASCPGGTCLDEALLGALDRHTQALDRNQPGTHLVVLHMMGSHGPAYWRRYPPAFARYTPACNDDDLARCSRAEIVNAYDNSLLYTDHVLAGVIGRLRALAPGVDSALLYVSDHGESLGERGIYLHGMPRAIAPREQLQVPMVMWLSDGFAASARVDTACLARRAREPAAHDHLFHTVLGLLDVRTSVHAPAWDLAAPCRTAASAMANTAARTAAGQAPDKRSSMLKPVSHGGSATAPPWARATTSASTSPRPGSAS